MEQTKGRTLYGIFFNSEERQLIKELAEGNGFGFHKTGSFNLVGAVRSILKDYVRLLQKEAQNQTGVKIEVDGVVVTVKKK